MIKEISLLPSVVEVNICSAAGKKFTDEAIRYQIDFIRSTPGEQGRHATSTQ